LPLSKPRLPRTAFGEGRTLSSLLALAMQLCRAVLYHRGRRWFRSSRQDTGHHLPAMTPIDSEVWVRCEYYWIGKRFRHAHQAGVSQAHRYACVFLQERHHWLNVFVEVELRDYGSPRKHGSESRRAPFPKQMVCFRQHRFTRIPGRRVLRRLLDRPGMVEVAAAKHCDQKTGVNEDASGHNPWFSSISSFARSGWRASRRPSRSGRRSG